MFGVPPLERLREARLLLRSHGSLEARVEPVVDESGGEVAGFRGGESDVNIRAVVFRADVVDWLCDFVRQFEMKIISG